MVKGQINDLSVIDANGKRDVLSVLVLDEDLVMRLARKINQHRWIHSLLHEGRLLNR